MVAFDSRPGDQFSCDDQTFLVIDSYPNGVVALPTKPHTFAYSDLQSKKAYYIVNDLSLTILVLERQGQSIDWVPVGYYGPFVSEQARTAWIVANPCGHKERYSVQHLSL